MNRNVKQPPLQEWAYLKEKLKSIKTILFGQKSINNNSYSTVSSLQNT